MGMSCFCRRMAIGRMVLVMLDVAVGMGVTAGDGFIGGFRMRGRMGF